MLVALAGGVGAARFLAGLVRAVPPDEVVAIVNTGDDDEFHGLHVSPDLDSVTYTLAGASNAAQGWGLEGETFATLDALARYDVPTWFRLGDKDLATHLFRTQRLRAGAPLSEVTAEITRAWGLDLRLRADDRRSRAHAHHGDRATTATPKSSRCSSGSSASAPSRRSSSVRFDGADHARPAPGVLEALRTADAIVICPSNPVISIGPILAVPGIRDALVGAARAGRRDQPDRRRRAGEGPGRSPHGPARHGGVVRRRGARPTRRSAARSSSTRSTRSSRRRSKPPASAPIVTDTMMRSPEIAAALARCTLAAVA